MQNPFYCNRLLNSVTGELDASVFGERYMSSHVRLSVVCRPSVTFVPPTQAIEIFGNVSTPFGIMAIS